MKITAQFVTVSLVLCVGSLALWVESGRSYNNYVAPLGDFKVVAEVKDFFIDLQLTFPEDPISLGMHGYPKNSWSDASPFGRFEVERLFRKPDGKIPYYSQIIFPSWFLAVLPFTLLFFSLKLAWQRRTKRPEQDANGQSGTAFPQKSPSQTPP